MAEVLLLVIFTNILSCKWSLVGVINDFIFSSGHTAKTIGTGLRKLADLSLLDYTRVGQNKQINLNFEHEFIQSLLIRAFGFLPPKQPYNFDEFDLASSGFIPANLDFDGALDFFTSYELHLTSEIEQYNSWLAWIDNWNSWSEEVQQTDFDLLDSDNPLVSFTESLVYRFEQAASQSVNHPTVQEMSDIISKLLSEEQVIPPWISEIEFLSEKMKVDKDVLEWLKERSD